MLPDLSMQGLTDVPAACASKWYPAVLRFASVVSSGGTKGSVHELTNKKFHLNIRKDFFFVVILIQSCNMSLEV